MIIGISGKIGSGKDTVGNIISVWGKDPWNIKKFADALKETASILTGIPRADFEKEEVKNSNLGKEWSMTVRELLQKLGTEAIRNNVHENAWVNALMSGYNESYCYWVVTDVRFPNEADAIRERGGILIRLNRNTGKSSNHPSETALDDYPHFDYVIDNNGTIGDLTDRVRSILKAQNISAV